LTTAGSVVLTATASAFADTFSSPALGPGFYDWPYDDYSYGSCRVPTRNGWVWAC
jgi:hypothetical protein